jgi:hypothetical protein
VNHDNPYNTWMPIAIIVVVMLLRSRNVGRERPFNMTLVWVLPAIAVAGIGAALALHPPALMGWAALALGLVLGAPLGWKRAKLTHIGRNEKGDLIIRHSAAAMILLVAVIALRQFARYEMVAAGPSHAEWLGWASDALMGFALGSILTFRGELWLRARAILAG